ncbi:MAG: BrnT family toxin [Lachnospiraceae bacterium]|nr:BrnT family toxin [Lachnospiraceae bacterium]
MFVFNDLQRIEIYDMEHSINEDHYNIIGMVNYVLFVVYTERKENIPLIPSRLSTLTIRTFPQPYTATICIIFIATIKTFHIIKPLKISCPLFICFSNIFLVIFIDISLFS